MSSPDRRISTYLPWLLLACFVTSGCSAPNFNFRDAGIGLSMFPHGKALERCEAMTGYHDSRDCTRAINSQYEAWESQQKKQDEVKFFRKSPGSP